MVYKKRKCAWCEKETRNLKFCSRSCSTKNSNKVSPKRWKTKQCKLCDTKVASKYIYCSKCRDHNKLSLDTRTISEVSDRYIKHHKSSAYALIRSRARIAMQGDNLKCENCGYTKHIEVAHIKPISKFSKDTPISEVNNKNNLLALCPNCHWEFDHDMLKLEDIKRTHVPCSQHQPSKLEP